MMLCPSLYLFFVRFVAFPDSCRQLSKIQRRMYHVCCGMWQRYFFLWLDISLQILCRSTLKVFFITTRSNLKLILSRDKSRFLSLQNQTNKEMIIATFAFFIHIAINFLDNRLAVVFIIRKFVEAGSRISSSLTFRTEQRRQKKGLRIPLMPLTLIFRSSNAFFYFM